MATEIRLSWHEQVIAAQVGVRRHLEAIRMRLQDRHGFAGDPWTVHIEGAAGEMAVAKALGIYWSGSVNTFKSGGDVGALQVRTRSRHDYDLIVRDEDRNDAVFVLVTGRMPDYLVHGWLKGLDAKAPQWRREFADRPGAYFVPSHILNPLPTLEIPAAP